MDISALARFSSAQSQAATGDAVATLVLKKAMDIQAQAALQLIDALPPVASQPPHLGQQVDVKA
jgi:hypothetical protein